MPDKMTPRERAGQVIIKWSVIAVSGVILAVMAWVLLSVLWMEMTGREL